MVDKTRYGVYLRRIGSRNVEQESSLATNVRVVQGHFRQLVASQDAAFIGNLTVFERQIVQLVYQHLLELLVHLTFHLEATSFESTIQVFEHDDGVVLNHHLGYLVNHSRKEAFFQIFDPFNVPPTLLSIFSFLLALFQLFLIVVVTNHIEGFLLQYLAPLIDKCQIYQMTLTTVNADDVNIRIILYIGHHLVVEFDLSICICIEHNRHVELVVELLGVSAVFDDFILHVFHYHLTDIGTFFCRQFHFCLLAVVELIETAIDGIGDRLSALGSAIKHLGAHLMLNGILDGLWAIEQFCVASQLYYYVTQILCSKKAFPIQGMKILAPMSTFSIIFVV